MTLTQETTLLQLARIAGNGPANYSFNFTYEPSRDYDIQVLAAEDEDQEFWQLLTVNIHYTIERRVIGGVVIISNQALIDTLMSNALGGGGNPDLIFNWVVIRRAYPYYQETVMPDVYDASITVLGFDRVVRETQQLNDRTASLENVPGIFMPGGGIRPPNEKGRLVEIFVTGYNRFVGAPLKDNGATLNAEINFVCDQNCNVVGTMTANTVVASIGNITTVTSTTTTTSTLYVNAINVRTGTAIAISANTNFAQDVQVAGDLTVLGNTDTDTLHANDITADTATIDDIMSTTITTYSLAATNITTVTLAVTTVTSSVTFNSSVSIVGPLTVGGLITGSDLLLSGNATVSGTVNAPTIRVDNIRAYQSNHITVQDAITFLMGITAGTIIATDITTNTLQVNTITTDVVMQGYVTIGRDVTMLSDLMVDGNISGTTIAAALSISTPILEVDRIDVFNNSFIHITAAVEFEQGLTGTSATFTTLTTTDLAVNGHVTTGLNVLGDLTLNTDKIILSNGVEIILDVVASAQLGDVLTVTDVTGNEVTISNLPDSGGGGGGSSLVTDTYFAIGSPNGTLVNSSMRELATYIEIDEDVRVTASSKFTLLGDTLSISAYDLNIDMATPSVGEILAITDITSNILTISNITAPTGGNGVDSFVTPGHIAMANDAGNLVDSSINELIDRIEVSKDVEVLASATLTLNNNTLGLSNLQLDFEIDAPTAGQVLSVTGVQGNVVTISAADQTGGGGASNVTPGTIAKAADDGSLTDSQITEDPTTVIVTSRDLSIVDGDIKTDGTISMGDDSGRTKFMSNVNIGQNNYIWDCPLANAPLNTPLYMIMQNIDGVTGRIGFQILGDISPVLVPPVTANSVLVWRGHSDPTEDRRIDSGHTGNTQNINLPSVIGSTIYNWVFRGATLIQTVAGAVQYAPNSTAITIDPKVAAHWFVQFNQNITITIASLPLGDLNIYFVPSGSKFTVAWANNILWEQGVSSLDMLPGRTSAVSFLSDGTNLYAAVNIGNTLNPDVPLSITPPVIDNAVALYPTSFGKVIASHPIARAYGNTIQQFSLPNVLFYSLATNISLVNIVGGILTINIILGNSVVWHFKHDTTITAIRVNVDTAIATRSFWFSIIKEPGLSAQTLLPLPAGAYCQTAGLSTDTGWGAFPAYYDAGRLTFFAPFAATM